MARGVTGRLVFVIFVATATGLAIFGLALGLAGDSGPGLIDQPQETVEGPLAGGTDLESAAALQEDQEFDRTVFRIEVLENGDARWTTQESRILLDEDEEQQFEDFAEQFESEEMDAFVNFQERATVLTDGGTSATDREMEAIDFEREAYVDPLGETRGVIEMSFVWTNFAEVDGDRVTVGDVFAGGWAITDNQRVQVTTGDRLEMDDAWPKDWNSGSLEENSLTWFGERQFADQRPRVEFVHPGIDVPGDDDADDEPGDDHDDETDDAESTGLGMTAVAVVVLLLAGIGLGLAWYSGAIRRGDEGGAVAESTSAGGAGASAESGAAHDPVIQPEETLSDEDRVVKLLEDNGGRMKQVNIVEETEWSKSKVSMLLSDMEEEGQISKLRVGRENIISLSGEEPDAARSPFDDS